MCFSVLQVESQFLMLQTGEAVQFLECLLGVHSQLDRQHQVELGVAVDACIPSTQYEEDPKFTAICGYTASLRPALHGTLFPLKNWFYFFDNVQKSKK